MEQDVRRFFVKVLYSLTWGLVWLFVNMTAGIYMGWLFFEGNMKTGNIIFYCFMVLTFGVLVRYYVRVWGKR